MEKLLDTIADLPDLLVYFILAVSAFVENLVPPIPGDTITAFGAFLDGTGRLSFFGVFLSTTVGSLLGFLTLFWGSRYLGRRFFFQKDYRFFRAKDILRAEAWFIRYGYLLIALNRFLPGVRSAVSLAAGFSGLKPAWVAPLALLSCALWNLVWILGGQTLGTHWELVQSRFSTLMWRYNLMVGIFLALFLFVWLVRKRARNGCS
ncbi:MAG: DedA family protein [Desulfatiglandales bacterium]